MTLYVITTKWINDLTVLFVMIDYAVFMIFMCIQSICNNLLLCHSFYQHSLNIHRHNYGSFWICQGYDLVLDNLHPFKWVVMVDPSVIVPRWSVSVQQILSNLMLIPS